jgi:ATP-dependent Zn protease
VANVCNEAALIAARNDAEFVTARDFELAIEVICVVVCACACVARDVV